MVEILYILGLVLGIVASICTISFTYYQYRKSKKDQRKGSSDAATSDKPDKEYRKDT